MAYSQQNEAALNASRGSGNRFFGNRGTSTQRSRDRGTSNPIGRGSPNGNANGSTPANPDSNSAETWLNQIIEGGRARYNQQYSSSPEPQWVQNLRNTYGQSGEQATPALWQNLGIGNPNNTDPGYHAHTMNG